MSLPLFHTWMEIYWLDALFALAKVVTLSFLVTACLCCKKKKNKKGVQGQVQSDDEYFGAKKDRKDRADPQYRTLEGVESEWEDTTMEGEKNKEAKSQEEQKKNEGRKGSKPDTEVKGNDGLFGASLSDPSAQQAGAAPSYSYPQSGNPAPAQQHQ